MEAVQSDLLEAKELAQSRLEEIETLSSQLVEAKKQLDTLQCQQQQLPESAVKEGATYKNLQSQFSIAAMEGAQLRGCLEEAKSLLMSARQLHFSQLEDIRFGTAGGGGVSEDVCGLEVCISEAVCCAGLRK